MDAVQSSAARTASAVLALSKTTWKLGMLLTKLDYDSKQVDTTIKNLSEDVKSFSVECDLVYVEMEDIVCRRQANATQPDGVEDRMWNCITTQVEEAGESMKELNLLFQNVRRDGSGLRSQAELQRKLHESEPSITSITTEVCRHANFLRTALLLISTAIPDRVPQRTDRPQSEDLEKLRQSIETLQVPLPADTGSRLTPSETSLVQYAHEVITGCVDEAQGTSNSCARFSTWMRTRESGQAHQQNFEDSNDFDDELELDLAKAALATGSEAFEARDWDEADSLLHEAKQIIERLPTRYHEEFSIFSLHYKLAVCAYYMKEIATAEDAFLGLIQEPASSNGEHELICDTRHRLSQLYIRKGDVERAHIECEKALQGRRKLLGKQNQTTFESVALMAHICVLLNSRARAKSYLAMIPEECRDAVVKTVQESLGTEFELLDYTTVLGQKTPGQINPVETPDPDKSSTVVDELPPKVDQHHPSPTVTESRTTVPVQNHQVIFPTEADPQNVPGSPQYSVEHLNEQGLVADKRFDGHSTTSLLPVYETPKSPRMSIRTGEISPCMLVARREILDKIGCQPRDQIEEAVCNGHYHTLSRLLNKKRDSWRHKLRRNPRSERVTALHFAALFGEVDMAKLLLGANYNINEVPYGYSTSLSPLKFAIGARQTDMVDFLLANGARPSEPDTWSTLAGQLLSRSWLMKTMSEAEKDFVATQATAILSILLKYGWDINAPFEASGSTLLHQAVTFWTGSFVWDVNLRIALTSFLCEAGANPFQRNMEGQTPFDQALATGHQDLISILGQPQRKNELEGGFGPRSELAG